MHGTCLGRPYQAQHFMNFRMAWWNVRFLNCKSSMERIWKTVTQLYSYMSNSSILLSMHAGTAYQLFSESMKSKLKGGYIPPSLHSHGHCLKNGLTPVVPILLDPSVNFVVWWRQGVIVTPHVQFVQTLAGHKMGAVIDCYFSLFETIATSPAGRERRRFLSSYESKKMDSCFSSAL